MKKTLASTIVVLASWCWLSGAGHHLGQPDGDATQRGYDPFGDAIPSTKHAAGPHRPRVFLTGPLLHNV